MERFFSLYHLTTEQLRELYRDARKVGKLLVEHDQPGVEEHYEISLPEEVILKNICGEIQNYLVFHEDFEEEPDQTTINFGLTAYPYTRIYIDLDNSLLDWFVKKYGLTGWWQMEGGEKKHYPTSDFYTLEPMKRKLIN